MEPQRAERELKMIRQLMERPVRYSTQSGYAGIIAGVAALAGATLDSYFSSIYTPATAVWVNMLVWVGVLFVALGGVLALTRLRERKKNMPFWSNVKKRIAMTIGPPFLAAAGLTAVIVYRWYFKDGPNQWGLISVSWMLFYGITCWQVGEFSIVEMRFLGVAFIVMGLLTAVYWQANPYDTLRWSFGGFHIIYGLVVRIRHGG
ncbi:MAG TPA: hypothetical protein ENL03_02085 [Phycisphaerae bacterium]|nr:hypothetical protein [Phycisphaerae bacterium]